jgi:hypothetical protein
MTLASAPAARLQNVDKEVIMPAGKPNILVIWGFSLDQVLAKLQQGLPSS